MLHRKKSGVAHRAWNLLRLALIWARKGRIFRRRLMMDLSNFLKSLRHHPDHHHSSIPYGEHELSFDATPIIHVKMHRPSSMRLRLPHMPCITPQVDFAYEFNNDYDDYRHNYYLKDQVQDDDQNDEDYDDGYHCEESGDEGIDLKAEEFITKFYQQMRVQSRQISYPQYNEMLD